MPALLRLAAAFLIAWPAALWAQTTVDSAAAPAPAIFAYLQYGDTVGFEAINSDSTMVRGIFLVPGQGSIGWDHWLENEKPGRLRLTWYPGDATMLRAAGETDYELHGDSMVVTTRDLESVKRDARVTTTGAIPAFGRSMTHLAYLAFHAVQSRLPTLSLFLTSSGKTVTASIRVLGEFVIITVDGLQIETEWVDGGLAEMRVPSQGLVVRRIRQ